MQYEVYYCDFGKLPTTTFTAAADLIITHENALIKFEDTFDQTT